MINIRNRLNVIRTLLANESKESLTYAALECRLTLELICYERLLISYDYISHDDLRKWQPKDVVHQVIEEANEHAASTFTISVSPTPVEKGKEPESKEDYERLEYVPIGTQVGFDYNQIGKLWNALSNIALHIQIPKDKSSSLSAYAESESLKKKINETIDVLDALEKGNLLSSGFGPEYSFECETCHTKLKRKINCLRDGLTISCMLPSCLESYEIHVQGNEILHSRRLTQTRCNKCKSPVQVPAKQIEKLRLGQRIELNCDSCEEPLVIELVPCIRSLGTEAPASNDKVDIP